MVYPTLGTGAKLRAVLLKNSYSLWLVKYSSIAQRDENVFILHSKTLRETRSLKDHVKLNDENNLIRI